MWWKLLLLHELAHCVDTDRAQDALSPLEKHPWKEVYADMVAVMVMRRYGVPAKTFEAMASLRGASFDRSLVDKWQGALLVASLASIEQM